MIKENFIKEIPRKTYAVHVKQNIIAYRLIMVKAYSVTDAKELALSDAEFIDFDQKHTYYSIDYTKEVKQK